MKDEICFDAIGITDDVMFGSVFQDSEVCKEFLQRILRIEIIELTIVECQKSIKTNLFGKGIRIDIYVKDQNGNSYDIEMQLLDTKELALRSRYYHSEMDSYQIKIGQKYKNLNESIVIFVCVFDPFMDYRSIYTFETVCRENPKIVLMDKRKTVFINIYGDRAGIEEKTVNLLDYLSTGIPTDNYTKKLQCKVEEIRNDDDWRDNYMTLEMKMDLRYEQGLEQGLEQLTNVALRLRNGESVNQLREEGISEKIIQNALVIIEGKK